MSKTEAKISIREIRCALSTEVALGGMTQEQVDHVSKCLRLDWKEADYDKRNDMECFICELKELLKKYDARIEISSSIYNATLRINDYRECLHFGGRTIDAEYVELFPKIFERQKIISKLNFLPTDHVDDIRPIVKAALKVDRKSWNYVTDDQFAEMVKPYKSKRI